MEIILIQKKIHDLRGKKIILDFDLAELYEVETRALNQAVKRNIDIFPDDFMFQLTSQEWESMSSQIVMTYPIKRPKTALPLAFTEHGVAMLSNILKSKKARQTSVSIVRAFIAMKQYLLNYKELSEKVKELEIHFNKQFEDVSEAINYLLAKDNEPQKTEERNQIGFK